MAFVTKTWKDRLVEYAGRRKLKNVATGEEILMDVSRSEGTVNQAGDAFSAANMNNLEQRIKTEFDSVNSSLANISFTPDYSKAISLTVAQLQSYTAPSNGMITFNTYGNTVYENATHVTVNEILVFVASSTSIDVVSNGTIFVAKNDVVKFQRSSNATVRTIYFIPFK